MPQAQYLQCYTFHCLRSECKLRDLNFKANKAEKCISLSVYYSGSTVNLILRLPVSRSPLGTGQLSSR